MFNHLVTHVLHRLKLICELSHSFFSPYINAHRYRPLLGGTHPCGIKKTVLADIVAITIYFIVFRSLLVHVSSTTISILKLTLSHNSQYQHCPCGAYSASRQSSLAVQSVVLHQTRCTATTSSFRLRRLCESIRQCVAMQCDVTHILLKILDV